MKYIKIFVALIIAGLLIWGVVSKAPSDNHIKVGVILPLTGQYASLGEADRNAMLMAKEELKADNIELFFEDDKYDAKAAVTVYKKLRDINNIDVVILLGAPSIQSVAPLTDADKIPLLGLGETLVHEKDSVFQLMPAGDKAFPALGKIYGGMYKNIVVAHSNASLFALNAKSFEKGLPADSKFTDVTIVPATDYRTEVSKIVAMKPQAVTAFLPSEDAQKFLKSLRILDPKGEIKVVCDFGTEIAVKEYVKAFGADRLEGCISTNLGETTDVDFKLRFKAKYGIDTMLTTDFSYDAVGIIQKLATYPKTEWIKKLSSTDFKYTSGASGEISFNDDGTRFDVDPVVHVFKDGKFVNR